MPVIQFLLGGVTIWIHECGHATVCLAMWIPGASAAFWLDETQDCTSLLFCVLWCANAVVVVVLDRKKRTKALADGASDSALAILQFYLTWLISENTYDLLLSFGGVGGEFYLSSLLIISFYFPMPEKMALGLLPLPAVLLAGRLYLCRINHALATNSKRPAINSLGNHAVLALVMQAAI